MANPSFWEIVAQLTEMRKANDASIFKFQFIDEINLVVGADAHIGPQKMLRIRRNQTEIRK